MSTSLEINVEADEWLDITTTEELLQRDVHRLNEALKARTAELEASNHLIQELSGHKTTLETDRVTLQRALKDSVEAFVNVESELVMVMTGKEQAEQEHNIFKAETVAKLEASDQSLTTARQEASISRNSSLRLECEIKDLKRQHAKESKEALDSQTKLTKVVSELKNKVTTLETTSKAQKKELAETRSQLDTVRKELVTEKKASSSSAMQLDLANKRLGSVAVLAEERKDERFALQRSVAQQKLALNHASIDAEHHACQIASLQKEIATIKSASEQRIKDLEQSLSVTQKDLQDANEDYKMQQNLAESRLMEIEDACGKLQGVEAELESATGRASNLQGELEASRSQEEALKAELEAQKVDYERRFGNIRDALGMKKTSEESKVAQSFKSLGLSLSNLL